MPIDVVSVDHDRRVATGTSLLAAPRALHRITKRDGKLVAFDAGKIQWAISKAGRSTSEFGDRVAEELTIRVLIVLSALGSDGELTVERVQDVVEQTLIASPYHRTAKAYVVYRPEFQAEMDLFNRAFLEVLGEGDASGRVFSFPIPTYNITHEFDYEAQRLIPLWQAAARYGIPYFANFVGSELSPEDARSMCCRLRLDTRELNRRGGGLFGAQPLTGSIGVVTLNLPRIGYLAHSEAEFFEELDRLLRIAVESLEVKRKVLERFTDEQLYPYVRYYLRDIKQRTQHYWTNHFATIGIVGLDEAVRNLLGENLASESGRGLGLSVLDHLRQRLVAVQLETGHLYNLEATPAEGTSHRLAKLDRERFPAIHVANDAACQSSAQPYYTNSSQLPVGHSRDPFEILEHQDDFQTRYTGGTAVHVYVGEAIDDSTAVREFVKVVCSNYRLPYFTVTPTFSICPSHGYLSGKHPTCPSCACECEVYSRVVGYLRPVSQWNVGKRAEFADRANFELRSSSMELLREPLA